MKRMTMLGAALLVAMAGFAQTDTTANSGSDTIRIGSMIIIKKNKGSNNGKSETITIEKKAKKPSKVSTNYFILDIGFANLKDDTEYGSAELTGPTSYLRTIRPGEAAFTKEDLELKTGKTTNVNLWLFMQKLNITKGILNLKYGLGLEMFNYRYENNISYHKNPSYIFRDSVSFSKNKLFTSYVSVPFMLNVNTRPGKKKGLSFSAGVTAGYLVGSRNKQISGERGKDKLKDDFNLEKFRLAYIGEVGLGPVRLFGSYSTTALHEGALKQYPYSFGLRLSNW